MAIRQIFFYAASVRWHCSGKTQRFEFQWRTCGGQPANLFEMDHEDKHKDIQYDILYASTLKSMRMFHFLEINSNLVPQLQISHLLELQPVCEASTLSSSNSIQFHISIALPGSLAFHAAFTGIVRTKTSAAHQEGSNRLVD